MADDKVKVVACTWLTLASIGAAIAISYSRESENVAHWLTARTFATETSLIHLTRCCRSCVLARSTSNIYVWMLPFSRSCTHWLSHRLYESWQPDMSITTCRDSHSKRKIKMQYRHPFSIFRRKRTTYKINEVILEGGNYRGVGGFDPQFTVPTPN